MKHEMVCRRWLCGLMAGFLTLSVGCTNKEQAITKPVGTPAQVTEPATDLILLKTEPADNSQNEIAPALREIRESEMPMLLTMRTSDKTCNIYRVMWNIKDATLSEQEFCYSILCDNYGDFWGLSPQHWMGGSTFIGRAYEVLDACAADIDYQMLKRDVINYGKCYYRSGSDVMQMENDDGSVTDIRLPADVPAEIYDSDKLTGSPYYATVDGDTAIVVYMRYQFSEGEDSDFVYCTYPVAQPEAAHWQVVAIPAAYCPDVILTKWRGAYSDGCLYFGTGSGFVSLNLAAGEFTEIANVEYIRFLSPEGSTVNPYWGPEYPSIYASQDGVLIGTFHIYEPNRSERLFFYAFQNNRLIAIVEFTDNVYTFYDTDLNVLNIDDTYADLPILYMWCAKDD